MKKQEEWDKVTELFVFLHVITSRIEIKTTYDGYFDKERTIKAISLGIEKLRKFKEKLEQMK